MSMLAITCFAWGVNKTEQGRRLRSVTEQEKYNQKSTDKNEQKQNIKHRWIVLQSIYLSQMWKLKHVINKIQRKIRKFKFIVIELNENW